MHLKYLNRIMFFFSKRLKAQFYSSHAADSRDCFSLFSPYNYIYYILFFVDLKITWLDSLQHILLNCFKLEIKRLGTNQKTDQLTTLLGSNDTMYTLQLSCRFIFVLKFQLNRDLQIRGRRRLRVRDFPSSFFAYSQTIDFPESFNLPFFTRKVSTVIFSEAGYTLSRSQNDKTSNI